MLACFYTFVRDVGSGKEHLLKYNRVYVDIREASGGQYLPFRKKVGLLMPKRYMSKMAKWKEMRIQTLHPQPYPVTDPEATPKPPGQLLVQFAKEPDAVAWKNLPHSLMSGSCDCLPKNSGGACWGGCNPCIPLQCFLFRKSHFKLSKF